MTDDITVYYYSCTGRSELAAQKIALLLNCASCDVENIGEEAYAHTAVIVFPVHCQGVPTVLKKLIHKIKAENYALCATYGGIHTGNALYEANKLIKGRLVCALYLCAPHSYTNINAEYSPEIPQDFIEKIKKGGEITLPKIKTAAFARVLPDFRSRKISSIKRTDACNKCGVCNNICYSGAINYGIINGKCIRCLKCVKSCPESALCFKPGRILKNYLKRESYKDPILYI